MLSSSDIDSHSTATGKTTITLDINFLVSMTGFDVTKLVLSNCTASNFAGSGAAYTVDITPTADGVFSVTVPDGAGISAGGATNIAVTYSKIYSSYMADILSLSPFAYWSMNEDGGTSVIDNTGNGRGAIVRGANVNQSGGITGKCYYFPGSETADIIGNSTFRAAMDPREYGIAFWMREEPQDYLDNQHPRLMEQFCGGDTEYLAIESKNRTSPFAIEVLLKEDGVQQNLTTLMGNISGEAWHLLVVYNSESGGVVGGYVDGQNYEASRTLSGITPPVSDGAPLLFRYLLGKAQHVVWFDHKPTQGEVNTLYAGGAPA